MADFITVAAFDAAPEAYIAKGLLEQAGIPAFIRNEHLVGVQWLYSNAVGGVEVQVAREDAAAALEVLGVGPGVAPGAGSEEGSEPKKQAAPVCPRCGGRDVRCRGPLSSLIAALLLSSGIPFPAARHRWRCKSCGAVWH